MVKRYIEGGYGLSEMEEDEQGDWVSYEDYEILRQQLEAVKPEQGSGWIEWGGGDCPVERMAIVEVKFTQTPQGEGIAHWWDWHHEEGENNIIAYRVVS